MSASQKNYKVGIYVRLSRDDERQGESVSIENQKMILTRYCEEQKWEIFSVYCDDGVSGTLSYKNHKQIDKPKSDWIKVENTHEPIIDADTWNACTEIDRRNCKPREIKGASEPSLFGGLLKCMDCGFKMRYAEENHVRKGGRKVKYISYVCGNYSRSGVQKSDGKV